MNERGHYGNRAFVGAEEPRADRPAGAIPWWKIAIGATVVLGVGYLVTRPITKIGGIRAVSRGVKTLEGSELVHVRGGVRY